MENIDTASELMKEIKLKDGFYIYQFPTNEHGIIGQNIFVLYNEEECIVFDAGYEKHMEQLVPILSKYKIKNVICTHFHPDHCYGLNVLPKQNLIGSKYAIETLEMFDDLSNELIVPNILIEEETVLHFGNHTITMNLNPGHSDCGMIIDIDGEFLLIGDDYMTSNNNEPVLPYIAANIEQHKQALLYLVNNYRGYTLLPSHGVPTNNVEDLMYRIRYLDFALTKEKDIDKFYLKGDVPFLSKRWHLTNIRR